jgi:hypothetical protein
MTMKRLLLAFILLVNATLARAVDYTDIWFNSSQSGYGFNMVESDDGTGAPFMFVTFFIYGQNGQPTWYVALVTWNKVDTFTGSVYATTGTFFGSPWNPSASTTNAVGTASFKPNPANNYEGTFSYTVNNVGTFTGALTRQTLTAIATAGFYAGAQTGTYSGCGTSTNNGSYTDGYTLSVVQGSNSVMTFNFTYRSGLTCKLIGPATQNGTYFQVPSAAYTCSDGTNATAAMSQIKVTSLGLEGKFSAPGGTDNCTEAAAFGGPRTQ